MHGVKAGFRRLVLCRHGETDFNASHRVQGCIADNHLNHHGQAQAAQLGGHLSQLLADSHSLSVSSSAMTRAQQTADRVAQQIGRGSALRCAGAELLVEMNFGELEGRSIADIAEVFEGTKAAWARGETDLKWPGEGGESPKDVLARGLQGLTSSEFLGAPDTDADVLVVVCHGRFNKIVLSHMLEIGLQHCSSISQDNTCFNVLDYELSSGRFEQVAINCIDHLPAEAQNAEIAKRSLNTPLV